ncbi:MAG: hypothetical protein HFJ89_00005 [Oscillospiraceae bacterium]|jgi:3'-phosphoadenosine 5'-phosphosulfate sulfotransferase (PAPS reductase)/FAD synthetase|nr:hypothetical protein [Oscillospiraceae bacterium]
MEHILSLSYGKDSLACLGSIEKLGLPLDRIIHAEIWATDTIPADLPPMVEFKTKADKIIKERYGITVEHVCSTNIDGIKGDKITFEDGFYHVLNSGKYAGSIKGFPMQQGQWCQKLKLSALKTANDIFYSKRQRGNRVGEIIGFPMIGACELQRALKVSPIRKAPKNCISYIGIAYDEPKRFKTLSDTKISPLVMAEWTESKCYDWCKQNDLLSPIYENTKRGGCWFCPNQPVEQLRLLRKNYPDCGNCF